MFGPLDFELSRFDCTYSSSSSVSQINPGTFLKLVYFSIGIIPMENEEIRQISWELLFIFYFIFFFNIYLFFYFFLFYFFFHVYAIKSTFLNRFFCSFETCTNCLYYCKK